MVKAGRSVDDLLGHIVEWGERLERIIEGVTREEFSESELHQLATSKCIEAIGEAAGNLRKFYPEFVVLHPELEFEQAYRTRNRLSHGYDTIDWSIVWTTAINYIPRLVADARRLIASKDG